MKLTQPLSSVSHLIILAVLYDESYQLNWPYFSIVMEISLERLIYDNNRDIDGYVRIYTGM